MDLTTVMNNFMYHPPHGDQPQRYEQLRSAGQELAFQILEKCPDCDERTIAIRGLEQVVMWANASIARNEAP